MTLHHPHTADPPMRPCRNLITGLSIATLLPAAGTARATGAMPISVPSSATAIPLRGSTR